MENFYLFYSCDIVKFRVYLNCSNSDLTKKFTEINRKSVQTKKFVLVIEAVKNNIANKTQFNWEASSSLGDIYAIKIDEHRFYTLVRLDNGYKELFICRYGRKQTQQNDKKLKSIIDSIPNIIFQKILS